MGDVVVVGTEQSTLRPVVAIELDAGLLGAPLDAVTLRVVREGLVNVARHAAGSTVRVAMHVEGEHGGRVDHGFTEDGGFRLSAHLPRRAPVAA
jgi:nitrate/nitrite-specific signal transduction histidine kinase